MSRSFKGFEFLSGAAPAGWIATAGVYLVSIGIEIFGRFGGGKKLWAYVEAERAREMERK